MKFNNFATILGALLLIAPFAKTKSHQISDNNLSLILFNEIDLLIPTLNSSNEKCRQHSEFYYQELKKFKLWATEMFDATSKFPSGVLSGSVYGLGNFDQCVSVKVPLENDRFSGKYCLAKFKLKFPNYKRDVVPSYELEKRSKLNVSVFEKLASFSADRSKGPRNEIFVAFCIPSSCDHVELGELLEKNVHKYVKINDLNIEVSVDKKHATTNEPSPFNVADIIYLFILVLFLVLCVLSTCYHLLTKLDDLRKFKLPENLHQIARCFSVAANLKKISKRTKDDHGLECINGIRVISMFFIIMGHRIMFLVGAPLDNPTFLENYYSHIEATVFLNGPIIVDTFFTLSGFLTAYLLLLELEKRGSFNFTILCVHRFIRFIKIGIFLTLATAVNTAWQRPFYFTVTKLTPAYAIVLGFYCTLFYKLGTGPLWEDRIGTEKERCLESWWTNLLYINNYFLSDKLCMFQSWYLTCEMHYVLIGPLLIMLLYKKPKIGIFSVSGLLIASVIAVFATVMIRNEDGILMLYISLLKDPVLNSTFKNIYIQTHLRASPYIVGLLTGYLKYKMKTSNYKVSKYTVYFGWIFAVFIILVTVYSGFIFYIPGLRKDLILSATYGAMHHLTFSVGISWIVLAVSIGHGAWIKPILVWKPLILMSRITYSAFLCHGIVQIYSAAYIRNPVHFDIFSIIYYSSADILLSFTLGLILSQCFEAPVLALEKIILGGGGGGEKKNVDKVRKDEPFRNKYSPKEVYYTNPTFKTDS